MIELAHICIQGPTIVSADKFHQSENNQLKKDASLPPSSTHICKMVAKERVAMDQTATVQLLLHRLDLAPEQGFQGTEKQEVILSYS